MVRRARPATPRRTRPHRRRDEIGGGAAGPHQGYRREVRRGRPGSRRGDGDRTGRRIILTLLQTPWVNPPQVSVTVPRDDAPWSAEHRRATSWHGLTAKSGRQCFRSTFGVPRPSTTARSAVSHARPSGRSRCVIAPGQRCHRTRQRCHRTRSATSSHAVSLHCHPARAERVSGSTLPCVELDDPAEPHLASTEPHLVPTEPHRLAGDPTRCAAGGCS